MITREEYEKGVIRMMDSMRSSNIGAANCVGVECEEGCPMYATYCKDASCAYTAYKKVEIVEEWLKDHPKITRRQKFEELMEKHFPEVSVDDCAADLQSPEIGCGFEGCDACSEYWDGEYVEPSKRES